MSELSLQRRLQSTSLLAVIAGYVVLLGANHLLANFKRVEGHRRQLNQIERQLLLQATDSQNQQRSALTGFMIKRASPGKAATKSPWMQHLPDGSVWLVSYLSVPSLSKGETWWLVREDITESVRQEWLAQMLLVAMAGVSSLITSALLRPVLRRGLVQPLLLLGDQLDSTQSPPTVLELLPEGAQPLEFKPIVHAFNRMQERLALSWQRERTFVDGAAHELRTPITLISGHAQSLQRQSLDPSVRYGINCIAAEAQRMGSLVSALLELARHDSGRLRLAREPLDLQQEVLKAYERLQPRSSGRLCLVETDKMHVDPFVIGDEDRLQQCVAELVENALRYSPAGSLVKLSYSVDGQCCRIHVVDEGPGVPCSERSQIFERFIRGSAAINVRGSGIGLALVHQIISDMGGRVEVCDASGGGSDFRLCLPLKS